VPTSKASEADRQTTGRLEAAGTLHRLHAHSQAKAEGRGPGPSREEGDRGSHQEGEPDVGEAESRIAPRLRDELWVAGAILVMDRGRIVERGGPQKCPEARRIVNLVSWYLVTAS